MPKPVTVYLVSSGDYSDYRINAACSTPAKAKAVIARLAAADGYNKESDYRIEPYVLDEMVTMIERGLWWWVVRIPDRDGETLAASARVQSYAFYTAAEYWKLGTGDPTGATGQFVACVIARDEPHAIKIASEWRARVAAADMLRPCKDGKRRNVLPYIKGGTDEADA